MNRKTFALFELLVVIAIIGILVALLIWAIVEAKKSAKYFPFKNSFGEIKKDYLENLNEKTRPIIQNWVDKKMAELTKEYLDAKNGVPFEEAANLSSPEEVDVAIIKLMDGDTREEDALNEFYKARDAARAYKFTVKENPEDYIER